MDRCDVGVVLGVISGAYAIFHSSVSFFFAGRYFVSELNHFVASYLVALGIAIMVLLGAFLANRGRKVTGGTLMLIVSFFDLVTSVVLLPPFVIASLAFLGLIAHTPFGILGGILVLSSKVGTSKTN
jgi:hypothetical protein